MKRLALWGMASLVLLFLASGSVAHANEFDVTGSLSATYYTLSTADADTGGTQCSPCGTYSSMVMPGLGPDGLPVYNPYNSVTNPNGDPHGVNDLNSNGEITWWSTSNPHVTYAGTGTILLPYSNGAMFPNGSTNDNNAFLTAEFQGTLTLTQAGTITFNLASDDDTFLYINGVLEDSDAGVHSIPGTPLVGTESLAAGSYSIELFYADRDQVAAALDFSMTSTTSGAYVSPVATPEPSTLSLLAIGLAGLLLATTAGKLVRCGA